MDNESYIMENDEEQNLNQDTGKCKVQNVDPVNIHDEARNGELLANVVHVEDISLRETTCIDEEILESECENNEEGIYHVVESEEIHCKDCNDEECRESKCRNEENHTHETSQIDNIDDKIDYAQDSDEETQSGTEEVNEEMHINKYNKKEIHDKQEHEVASYTIEVSDEEIHVSHNNYSLYNVSSLQQGLALSCDENEQSFNSYHQLLVQKLYGGEALHCAAERGDCRSMRMLIERGANVNERDNTYWTPLHVAVSAGHEEVVDLLMESGADLNLQDNSHFTPLMTAVFNGRTSIVAKMLDAGARYNMVTGFGVTVLHIAVKNGLDQLVNILVKKLKTDPNFLDAADYKGESALHMAVARRQSGNVSTLIDGGANILLQDSSGFSPFHCIGSFLGEGDFENLKDICALLLTAGVPINLRSKDGNTPLMCAVNWYITCFHLQVDKCEALTHALDESVIPFLLERGADINTINADGKSSVMLVAEKSVDDPQENRHFHLIKMLLQHHRFEMSLEELQVFQKHTEEFIQRIITSEKIDTNIHSNLEKIEMIIRIIMLLRDVGLLKNSALYDLFNYNSKFLQLCDPKPLKDITRIIIRRLYPLKKIVSINLPISIINYLKFE